MFEMSFLSDIGANLNPVIEFMGYLIFTFIGSLFKEIYNTNSKEDYEFKPHQVISSTIAASFTCVFARSMYLSEYDFGVMAFVSFTLGLLGFEIFKNLSSVKGIQKLLNIIKGGDASELDEDDGEDKEAKTSRKPKENPRSNISPQLTPTIKIHIPKKKNENDED